MVANREVAEQLPEYYNQKKGEKTKKDNNNSSSIILLLLYYMYYCNMIQYTQQLDHDTIYWKEKSKQKESEKTK